MNWNSTIRDRARDVLRRSGADCWICGAAIDYTIRTPDPMSFEIDHKKALDTHPELACDPGNWAAAHRRCNRLKSNKEFAPIIRRSGALA